mgnify:CR=1 FL=1
MPKRTPRHQPLRLRFPLLWESTQTPPDLREDLARTDSEFGAKWRRHKTDRLAELHRHEDQLALVAARRELDQALPILAQLNLLTPGGADLRSAATLSPVDGQSAEIVYRLTTLRLQPTLTVADHELGLVLDDLRQLDTDALGHAIVREAICSLVKPTTYLVLGKRHGGKTKQTVADRKRRLECRLIELGERRALSALCEALSSRLVNSIKGPTLPTDNPFNQIALLPHEDEFPDVIDVVKVGLWLASAGRDDERRPGFQIQQDGSLTVR